VVEPGGVHVESAAPFETIAITEPLQSPRRRDCFARGPQRATAAFGERVSRTGRASEPEVTSMRVGSGLIAVVATFFLLMGLIALAAPAQVLAPFGVSVTTIDGRNEVRAVYGGFGVAVAMLLIVARSRPVLRGGVLVAVATALAGMAAGRVLAALVDGPPGPFPRLFCAVELVLAAMLIVAHVAAAPRGVAAAPRADAAPGVIARDPP